MARAVQLNRVDQKKLKLQKAQDASEVLIKASQLNVDDPFRKGAVIELPLQGDLLVAADIHGNRQNFNAIVKKANLKKYPNRHLVFLGDLIHSLDALTTGKDYSCLLVEEIANLKIRFPNQVHILLGNHELSEFLGRKIFKDGRMLNFLFTRGLHLLYGNKGSDLVRSALNRFFASLPLVAVTQTEIMISHSTPELEFVDLIHFSFFEKKVSLKNKKHHQKIEELVWGRDFSQETAELLSEKWGIESFIIGHEKCDEGYDIPNSHHIILDSTDEHGTYILFKLNQPYAQKGLVKRIKFLH